MYLVCARAAVHGDGETQNEVMQQRHRHQRTITDEG
jgi:hypothetical protein